MTYDGIVTDDIPGSFSHHLARAFEDVDEQLHDDSVPFNTRLRQIWEESYSYNQDYEDIGVFHPTEVLHAIQAIDVKKDPGYMQLHPTAFIKHAEKMADILTPLFNACVSTQWTPPELLRTILIPIPKAGSKTEIKNYRGIAISNIICKI